MYAGEDFLSCTPNEIRVLSFNFDDAFADADAIQSAVWTSAVAADNEGPNDPTASSRIGAPFGNTGHIASATFSQGVNGVHYLIKCVALAASGQKAGFESYILCTERT